MLDGADTTVSDETDVATGATSASRLECTSAVASGESATTLLATDAPVDTTSFFVDEPSGDDDPFSVDPVRRVVTSVDLGVARFDGAGNAAGPVRPAMPDGSEFACAPPVLTVTPGAAAEVDLDTFEVESPLDADPTEAAGLDGTPNAFCVDPAVPVAPLVADWLAAEPGVDGWPVPPEDVPPESGAAKAIP